MSKKHLDPLDVTSRPLAAAGLKSYRSKCPFGWVMIGAKDDADALIQARRSHAKTELKDLQRWDGSGYVPLQAGKDRAMARDSYKTVGCSALMGVFLFKHGARIEGPGESGEPLQFCAGDRKWIPCPRGMVDVVAVVRQQMREVDSMGMRHSDLPEDWGVVANEAGEITHRAYGAGIWEIQYLGHSAGPLVDHPLTIEQAGIEPLRATQRQRG